MNMQEFIKEYPNKKDSDEAISKMSYEEITEIIDSMGTVQGKIAAKKAWEKLTGNKYIKKD